MTLAPIFRSPDALEVLADVRIREPLAEAARGQARAVCTVKRDLPNVIGADFIDDEALRLVVDDAPVQQAFVQEFFFLILFRSVLQTLGVSAGGLDLCAELNFCISGTIAAADNLFDDQNKLLLPLKKGNGARFQSILQLLTFERLSSRSLERGIQAGDISRSAAEQFHIELLSRMAAIGTLEGSEESGVDSILDPETMIERVHRVRGGALFELAFVAPPLLVTPADIGRLGRAQTAISGLGTAFQIVDDVTDFEFDLSRASHNLLVSQITHFGTADERASLNRLRELGDRSDDIVADRFPVSARAVVERGEREAREALRQLQAIGFWFPQELASQLVRAIVGEEGAARMARL